MESLPFSTVEWEKIVQLNCESGATDLEKLMIEKPFETEV